MMERLMHSLKVFWRSERLLKQREVRLAAGRLQFTAIAAFAAVAGLVMLNAAAFFALSTYWGNALAALTLAGADFVVAAALALYARSLEAGPEIEAVTEVRDMAIKNIEEEMALVEAELVAMRDSAHKFLHHPTDAMLPGFFGPLLGVLVKNLGSSKK